MPFRGHLVLNGTEIANSSRLMEHLGRVVPTSDIGIIDSADGVILVEEPPGSGLILPNFTLTAPGLYDPEGLTEDPDEEGLFFDPDDTEGQCALVEVSPGMYEIPESSYPIGDFYAPPNGARQWAPGVFEVTSQCWEAVNFCNSCRLELAYDDSWEGLREYLESPIYRPELAPWYTTRIPESAEFAGVWIMDITGLDVTPSERPIVQSVGSGGVAGRQRDGVRMVTFEALIIACSNAGATYGLQWLTCQLRDTNDVTDSVLTYFAAHPGDTKAVASDLEREAHGVVMTQPPSIVEKTASVAKQANIYRVQWEMAITNPYVYLPRIELPVTWDVITAQSINWVHAVDCVKPIGCETMPVLFSTDCEPEYLPSVTTAQPVCGGCMPLCTILEYVYNLPSRDYIIRCAETAINIKITNTGAKPLTLQGYFRICGTDARCEDNRWPVQISGLPQTASITLDAITASFYAELDGITHYPANIVNTPTGAPWIPPVLDRGLCWEFVVLAPVDVNFDVHITLADREA